ncbi:PilZ domain-containing protein [Roseibium aquae]|nr:PilZ domain-containing protein [Roseibium aquae]
MTVDAALLTDARKFPRRRCSWAALLKHGSTHRHCIVEDISAGGCRVATKTKGLAYDDRVIIEVASKMLRFHGEVRWIREGEAGIEFLFMD